MDQTGQSNPLGEAPLFKLICKFAIPSMISRKRVIVIRIEKKQDSLYTKGTLNLAFYLQFS